MIVSGRVGMQVLIAAVLFVPVVVAAIVSTYLALAVGLVAILLWPVIGDLRALERERIELNATHLVARGGLGPPRCALLRDAITDVSCVAEPGRGWAVDVSVGDARYRIAAVPTRAEAEAITALIAAELGLPAAPLRATIAP